MNEQRTLGLGRGVCFSFSQTLLLDADLAIDTFIAFAFIFLLFSFRFCMPCYYVLTPPILRGSLDSRAESRKGPAKGEGVYNDFGWKPQRSFFFFPK